MELEELIEEDRVLTLLIEGDSVQTLLIVGWEQVLHTMDTGDFLVVYNMHVEPVSYTHLTLPTNREV